MIRRALGRGLDALIESGGIEREVPLDGVDNRKGERALLSVGLDQIEPNPFQPRRHFDSERLGELARAIESQGVVEPLVVRPAASSAAGDGRPRYQLVAGERRLRAARLAGLGSVPVIVRELDDRAALEVSLVENLAREDLNAVEEAQALLKLAREFGLGHEEIAARIGKSRPYVSNAIRLLELPAAVLEMIDGGELTAGQARPLLALPSDEARLAAARRIAAEGISARGAERIASAGRRRPAGVRATGVDANLEALAEGLRRALRRKVRIVRRRGKVPGRIEIDYYDDADLDALAATLSRAAR